jgi:cytidylate kinase
MSTSLTSAPSTSAEARPTSLRRLPDIAIYGKAGAGKTTGADFLVRHFGYTRHSFANTLKDVAATIWGGEVRTDRDKLQKLGVAVREIDQDAWVNALLDQLDGRGMVIQTHPPFVIDDCRFDNEYWALKERGFVFVRVNADEVVRESRLLANGKLTDRSQLYHESELGVDQFTPDYEVVNNLDQEIYEADLLKVLNREQRMTP